MHNTCSYMKDKGSITMHEQKQLLILAIASSWSDKLNTWEFNSSHDYPRALTYKYIAECNAVHAIIIKS